MSLYIAKTVHTYDWLFVLHCTADLHQHGLCIFNILFFEVRMIGKLQNGFATWVCNNKVPLKGWNQFKLLKANQSILIVEGRPQLQVASGWPNLLASLRLTLVFHPTTPINLTSLSSSAGSAFWQTMGLTLLKIYLF